MAHIPCASGRAADLGGAWMFPCLEPEARNVLGFTDKNQVVVQMHFCDRHMGELIALGLVDDPDPRFESLREDRGRT